MKYIPRIKKSANQYAVKSVQIREDGNGKVKQSAQVGRNKGESVQKVQIPEYDQVKKQAGPHRVKYGSTITKKNDESKSQRAKERWVNIVGKIASDKTFIISSSEPEDDHEPPEGLIDEIKKKAKQKQHSKVNENVLSILKTQANRTEKVFERQKYSTKDILIRKRGFSLTRKSKTNNEQDELIAEYNRQAELLYKITPEIQMKLDKIQKEKDAATNKRGSQEDEKAGFFSKLFGLTIIMQTLKSNPRFYTMDPLEHLPETCRRCRRPLKDTLEPHFTSIGILFLIFLPIIGILLLYANREFVCVICEEVYVYGDLTARPDDDYDDDFDDDNDGKK